MARPALSDEQAASLSQRLVATGLVNLILAITLFVPVLLWSFPVMYVLGDPEHGPGSWLLAIIPTLIFLAIAVIVNLSLMAKSSPLERRWQVRVAVVLLFAGLVVSFSYIFPGFTPW